MLAVQLFNITFLKCHNHLLSYSKPSTVLALLYCLKNDCFTYLMDCVTEV